MIIGKYANEIWIISEIWIVGCVVKEKIKELLYLNIYKITY